MDEILYSVDAHVATITINRPADMNTISGPMLDALSARLVEADADPDVRVVVLTGEGRIFCAGLDLRSGLKGLMQGQGMPPTIDLRNTPPTILFDMDKPTLCALNGAAAGYGLDLAICCDMRIAGESARLVPGFAKRGILPESGGTWHLPRLLGWAKAAEICFTGRTLSSAESLALGLVNEVVPDAELADRARALALEIAANAPLAVQATKRMMRMGQSETFRDHVHHVYLQLLPLAMSEDAREGMTAFMEKRPATFHGR